MHDDQENLNEWIIINLLHQAREIIEKYENKYLDGDEKILLQTNLKKFLVELQEIQSERIDDLLKAHKDLNNLPEVEYELQRELNAIILKIKNMIW